MTYVVYGGKTTLLYPTSASNFRTEAAAKAARTRLYKKNPDLLNKEGELLIADTSTFHESIEKVVVRINLLSGNEYHEPINTPNYLSPASEVYWST
jgi:hypothetical protein